MKMFARLHRLSTGSKVTVPFNVHINATQEYINERVLMLLQYKYTGWECQCIGKESQVNNGNI